ncbi:MAG: MG2 domain-containing protein [Proteobacteria bacterium]|nr:MG2 domain-containing protein [Pseudomonadota bacterium]
MIAWAQSTKLAIDAHADYEALTAHATELATGKPAKDVAFALRADVGAAGVSGTSDVTGLARLAYEGAGGYTRLVATRGEDVAFLVGYGPQWSQGTRDPARLAWYVVDDRQLYRPGEDVSLKGWLRVLEGGKGGDVAASATTKVSFTALDSRGNKIGEGTADVNAAGAFDARFTLPKTPNLGYARVVFSADPGGMYGNVYTHQLRVEEFRRPEFEVKAAASQGPFLVGQGGDVTVSAKYYAGGGLPGAPVVWNATATSTSFTPPNRDDYSFGTWSPWWIDAPYGGYGGDMYDDEGYYDRGYRGGWRRGGGGGGKDKVKRAKASYQLAAKTDGGGEHVLHLDFLSVKPSVPMQVTTTASVTDVNRQQWSAATTMIVHPASRYVGMKSARPFVDVGTPFDLSVIGVDLDGKIATGAAIALTSVRLAGDWEKGEYKIKELDPQACAITIAGDAGICHFTTPKGGEFKVTATITDPQGRTNQSTFNYWVTGGDQLPAREVSQETIKLIPDKKEYTVGNTAELLVQVPFFPADGVITWRRQGIVKLEHIAFDGPTTVIKVPIEDAMTPNLVVQVDLVGTAPRLDDSGKPDPKLPRRPAYAEGSLSLKIPPKQRTLAVTVAPEAAKVSPAAKTSVTVEVRDAAGKPVADAEVAVIVVDESILSLAAYSHPDPIDTYYGARNPNGYDSFLHQFLKLARPDTTVTTAAPGGAAAGSGALPPPSPVAAAAPMASEKEESGGTGNAMALDEGKMGKRDDAPSAGKAAPKRARQEAIEQAQSAGILGSIVDGPVDGGSAIAVRSNFNPLAAFAPVVKTDANGKATAQVTMPDNLTRYRIIAIASSDTRQFGKGESAITARLPLMVRPSAPRFLNFGDTFQFPIVVQNQTDAAMTVKLAIRATNARLTDGAGREITVPANDRVEVRFPAAAEMAGTARFQVVGSAGSANDAAEVSLPVWTPATTEAFATYGTIDDGAVAQPIALPGKVVTEFGGLEITTASTNLAALTDAFLYIVHYKFDCAEQRASRVMSIVALQDVLAAFKAAEMPTTAELAASMDDDMKHLTQMQNPDGGFVYWERGWPSEPYLSVYVANALQRAKDKGHAVPPAMLERAKAFLREIEQHYPWFYGPEIRYAISAYALSTRKLMGDLDLPKAKTLYVQAGGAAKMNLETGGWLLATFAGNPGAASERAELVRNATNKVSETAGAANFTVHYDDGGYLLLASDRRVDAIMLDALIQEQPANDLIPKVVTGLLGHRKAGKWLSTQENTWALVALDRYFRTYEKVTPDFVARLWLGADYAGDHPFKGRQTDQFQVDIPMSVVATHDKQNLTIQKDGKGRLYYRVGMKYAPASLKLDAADYGFVVTRTYEGIDDPKDVTRAPDGVWHIKAGARVRVKLEMANENRRYHVALVDPLPAGLEAVNPTLGVSAPVPPPDEAAAKQPENRYSWWYRTWYDHQNMRDERVEAFTQLLWEGVHSYDYVARATTPGNFVVPPPKAEEMYMPETFGRGASDRVIVE